MDRFCSLWGPLHHVLCGPEHILSNLRNDAVEVLWALAQYCTFSFSSSGQEGFVQYSIRYSKCTILWYLRFDTCLGSGLGFNWFWCKYSDTTGCRTSISRLFSLLEYDKKLILELLQWVKFDSLLLMILWYIRQNALELALDHRSPSPKGFPDPSLMSRAQAKLRHTFSFPRTWHTHASQS